MQITWKTRDQLGFVFCSKSHLYHLIDIVDRTILFLLPGKLLSVQQISKQVKRAPQIVFKANVLKLARPGGAKVDVSFKAFSSCDMQGLVKLLVHFSGVVKIAENYLSWTINIDS